MAKIDTLREKLQKVAEQERDVIQQGGRHQFFIELYGTSSLDEMLNDFTPDEHNSQWNTEYQKIKQNTADIDELIKNRRAVAYMYSGKQCCRRHYDETELALHVMGINRRNWMLNEFAQLEYTQKEGSPVWTAKE